MPYIPYCIYHRRLYIRHIRLYIPQTLFIYKKPSKWPSSKSLSNLVLEKFLIWFLILRRLKGAVIQNYVIRNV